jgi:hypothetical protein
MISSLWQREDGRDFGCHFLEGRSRNDANLKPPEFKMSRFFLGFFLRALISYL